MLLDPIGHGRFIVADDDERVMKWVSNRIAALDNDYVWPMATAIGLASSDGLIAGLVVHDYCPKTRNCQLTVAADRPQWATKASIGAFMRYPFNQLGCGRVTAFCAASNVRAIRFNEGIGFKREGLMRRGFGDQDSVIMGLLKEEAPAWMGLQ